MAFVYDGGIMGGFLASISRREWVTVLVAALIAMILVAAPSVFAWDTARIHGLVWTGRGMFAPQDFFYYVSQIEQARVGRWLFTNYFTSEQTPDFFNIFWLFLGWFARLTDLSSVFAYHVVRILLVPVFAVVSYGCIAVFVKAVPVRLLAFFFFFFGGGFGWIQALVRSIDFLGDWPIDKWVPDAFPFFTMLYSPHFTASWIFLLGVVCVLVRALQEQRGWHGWVVGILSAILLQFHPYHLFTILLLLAMWMGVHPARKRGWRLLLPTSGFVILVLAYHVFLNYSSPVTRGILLQSETIMPRLSLVLAGFGLFIPWAIMGARILARPPHEPVRDFLFCWAIGQPLLFYLPVLFNRRLIEGWFMPLSILSALTIYEAWRSHRCRSLLLRAAVVILVITTTGTSVFLLVRHVRYYTYASQDSTQQYLDEIGTFASFALTPRVYITEAEQEVSSYIASLSDATVVLAMPQTSNTIAGLANRHVYAGQHMLVSDGAVAFFRVAQFFSFFPDKQREDFVRTNGITHLVVGPWERTAGWSNNDTPAWLTLVYQKGEFSVYEVKLRDDQLFTL